MEIKVENLRPVADRVVVRPEEKESKTSSGVYKPISAKQEHEVLVGLIEAVGPGTPDSPMILKKGERVLFPENTGTVISGGLIIMKESQILTVI